jgi:predicted DNA-binding protein
MKMIDIHVWLPPEQVKTLKRISKKHKRTASAEVRLALGLYLKELERREGLDRA